MSEHFNSGKIKNELQDILSNIMMEDRTTIDLIRNNAKMIGGVLGAETQYFKDTNQKVADEDLFIKKSELDIQNITFADIENT